MPEAPDGELFPVAEVDRSTRSLASQMLRGAVKLGHELMGTVPIGDDQIQPASIDLRLGEVAYRVRASFLAGRPQYGEGEARPAVDAPNRSDGRHGAGTRLCLYRAAAGDDRAAAGGPRGGEPEKFDRKARTSFARVITDHGHRVRPHPRGLQGTALRRDLSPRAFRHRRA